MKTLAIIALCLALFCSCHSIKYVPIETARLDTIYVSRTQTDSIYIKDSIYINRGADTIRVEKYNTTYKYLTRHDTLWKEKVDTIQIAYPVEVELTRWQRIKMTAGQILFIAIGLGLIALIIWLVVRLKT